MKKAGVLGSGVVGTTLADGLLKHDWEVMRGSRDPQKLEDWRIEAGEMARTGTFEEAARFGSLIILAVRGIGAESALGLAGTENLAGKTIIDVTNPIGNTVPVHGVLPFFTDPNESLMERLQRQAPEARFVKAFSCVGAPFMIHPAFPGGPPTMFICGNDPVAKAEVKGILDEFGWEAEDMGPVEAARAIEPLSILWCIPGFTRNSWSHAFKLLKK